MRNGTELSILVDPLRRVVEIVRRGMARRVTDADLVEPGPPLDGFVLNARAVYDVLDG